MWEVKISISIKTTLIKEWQIVSPQQTSKALTKNLNLNDKFHLLIRRLE